MQMRTQQSDTQTNSTESIQLTQCEDVIRTSQRWAVEEAKALLKIRTLKLWRVNGYESFEAYGLQRWGYEHSQLYRLCGWAEVIETVSPVGENIPQRETHARPLYGLTAEQQRDCWRAVCRKTDTPTAVVVSEVVEAQLRRSMPHKPSAALPAVSGSVLRGDAVEMLATLEDGSVDLLLTSPPYAMQRSKDYPSVPENEYPAWTVNWFEAARPKMTVTGNIMFVAREHVRGGCISDYLLRTRLALRDNGWNEIDVLVWNKPDAPPTGRPDRPRRSYEYVFWFSTTTTPFSDMKACGNPVKESRERMGRHRTIKNGHHGAQPFMRFKGDGIARVTDVLTAPMGTSSAGNDHPAPYPLSLCDQLIRTYSPSGGLVADPMCGSGTTLVAARDAGRHWWGCDVVPRFVAMTRNRLKRN